VKVQGFCDTSERQRTDKPLSHGGNTGSNPVGDANNFNNLYAVLGGCVQPLANI